MGRLRRIQLSKPRTRGGMVGKSGTANTVIVLDGELPEIDDDGDELDPPAPVWVQVAEEGDYKGYAGGAFKFDAAVFNQVVRNFRTHPAYKAGPDGKGASDVVHWDFHHASEQHSTDGSLPITGAPAQGWIQELDVRLDASGRYQLWALTRWLEPARSYIREGRYRWASVTVYFSVRDPKTNEDIGAVLTSVALTNQPFIEGMTPLAAERNAGGSASLSGPSDYYYPCSTPDEVLSALRQLFGIPNTTGISEVLRHLMQLQEWVVTGGQPLGVNLDGFVGAMRKILNLPALSSNDDVFAEASKLLQRLLEQEIEQQPITPPVAATPEAVASQRTHEMELIKKLAAKLGVVATEAAVADAVEGNLTLRASLAKNLGVKAEAADAILLEAAAAGGGVRAKLEALLKALGVEDGAAAVDKIAGLMKQAADLELVMPELSELREMKASVDEEKIDEDVEEVMSSRKFPEEARPALLSFRKMDSAAFASKYPKQDKPAVSAASRATNPASAPHLLTTLASTPRGSERRVTARADGSVVLSGLGRADAGNIDNPGTIKIDLTKYAKPNRFARLCAYVQETEKLASWDDVTARAHELITSKNVELLDV